MMAAKNCIPSIEGYIITEKLGSGSYGEVYKAFKKEGKKEVVAIKCVALDKLSPTAQDNIISEIHILKKLNHENIVRLNDFTWDKTHIYLIMEYCSGGNLSTFIHKKQRLSESLCRRFLQQLVCALFYLRERNISHFDLKPQNIFLASKKLQILKIGDFGLAQYMQEEDINSSVKGSPLYMAPEIIMQRGYDAKADIWSVGIILYECLFGKAPYSSKSFEELINKIKDSSPIKIPANASVSPDCRDFLTQCLERDPSKRIDFSSFFAHPFVDLEHVPNSESLSKASSLLVEALEQEESENFSDSFNLFHEALKYLVPVMEDESDCSKKIVLKKKINSYLHQMEKIKLKLEDSEVEIADVHNVSKPFANISKSEKTMNELLNLAKTTPPMVTAVEIAQSGELYEMESNFSAALEKYEMALGKLLDLLQLEPKGRRRDLLMEETNRWMLQAETVKDILETSIKNKEELIAADAEKTCSIQ